MNMGNNKSNIDFDDVQLSQIIDLDFLQRFQNIFADTMGVASIAVDIDGNPISDPSNFTRFCMDLTRGTDKGLKRCMACDAQGGKMASDTGKAAVYECHAGLVDFAAPIMLEGRQIGSILGGQVLTEEPDEEKFRKIANEIGVDEDEYINAVKEIRPIPREKVEKAGELLHMVAKNISEMGYRKYRINKVIGMLNDNLEIIASTMEELAASAMEVSESQDVLTKEINNVSDLSGQISHFISFIKSIADETNLLGLNASIEAARAKELGRGFSIVAKRIRKLSDDSMETVSKINKFTSDIEKSVKRTVKMGENTSITSQQQAAGIEEVTSSVQELSDVAHQLMELTK
jgi:ligand-binding sensor protein